MSDDINYKNNPLHGLSLKNLLIEIVEHYGFEILYAYLNINCFKMNPSIESSLKFLKKTDWAREKIEAFYLYQYKNLPRADEEQYALPPRDRIIPDDQTPGEPAKLSLEDAERLRERRAKKAADRKQQKSRRNDKPYRDRSENNKRRKYENDTSRQKPKPSRESSGSDQRSIETNPSEVMPSDSTPSNKTDPWSKWR